ncbi:undecaprenyl-phosphate glucose phosphotransferase [Rhizobium sp. KVB221]|uniref:Undecaprenyl-phosphate glucose phosphotransferase n=1 Tax=Rhizobium setariae TaxID=2801340 RepID=A0A937CNM1_9HYPH|nr:undecaprenyl-phosphate glucose phosphotransferase [Rhizobium setariae]MBL0371348.1 undecaprenyl-phosphate glucose phosphotransferase [Rhizobium setariae]
MSEPEKDPDLDVDRLRKQVSEIRTLGVADKSEANKPVELNGFAKRIAEQYREDKYSPAIMRGMFRLVDFLALFLIGQAINFFYSQNIEMLFWYMPVVAGGSALSVLFLQLADCYQIPVLRTPRTAMGRILGAWALSFASMALTLFFLKSGHDFSRLWFGSWFIAGAAYLVPQRFFLAWALRHWLRNGVLERRAVIVCGGRPAQELIRSLESQPDNDIRILGVFDDRLDRRSPELIAGYPKLGTVAELVEFVRLARVDMLIISLPMTAEKRILDLLRKLWILPVDIRIAAHATKLKFRPRAYSHIGRMAMLDVFDKPITDWDSVAKRIFDIFFSIVAITLLWPIMLGAAIAVKSTSKGPIIFKQKRHGFNNEIINVYKFRSMYTDLGDPTAAKAVTKGDPRVTRVGRFIRKTSIDELPQFFNVLKGDLSLVGPRPHAVLAQSHDRVYADIVEGYFARHRVKPGVTGWAQINGWRGEIDSDEKIKYRTAYDLHYIENWSLLFDLKILFLTPIRLFNTENAY